MSHFFVFIYTQRNVNKQQKMSDIESKREFFLKKVRDKIICFINFIDLYGASNSLE